MSAGDKSSASGTIRVRESVVAARQRLAAGYKKLRAQHDSGSPGIQVCAHLSDLWDGVVLEIFEAAIAEVGDELDLLRQMTLVPHGGYGRRDVAPFSDMDLLVLHEPSVEPHIGAVARRLVADISDVGIELGFSVRTRRQAVQMGRRDPVIFTSQAEARYLAGSATLLSKFGYRFRQDARKRVRLLLPQIEKARKQERVQYGETAFLLEPDIKRSVGGLRDIHFIRWIGFARHGESSPANLRLMGVLSKEDERALRKAHEFLLRLRNELHFKAGRPYDVLNRGEQLRIAEKWGYEGSGRLHPVQQFMQDYFRHTSSVKQIADNFLASARVPSFFVSLFSPIVSHRMDDFFIVGPTHISATKEGLKRLEGNLAEVLRLMSLANQADKRIAIETWNAIRKDMLGWSDIEVTPEAARRFMSLLSYTARLGRLLRRLHELRVLEKLVVGMEQARFLLQFNQYHKYTVDEHSIQAVERVTEFFSHPGTLGKVYRSIKRRSILHLAMLIHDLGKGYEEEHCIVGERLAKQTAARLQLSPQHGNLLQFLVGKHLLMSHLAFRRDTSDESLIHQFAIDVGTLERLRMLYVLTAADLAAVGPGVLNPWKVDVLTSVYKSTSQHLGATSEAPSYDPQAEALREAVEAAAPTGDSDTDWYRRQIQSLPITYLAEVKKKRAVKDLKRLRRVEADGPVAWGRYSEKRKVSIYKVGLPQTKVFSVFHRLVGVLTHSGMQLLVAHVHTLDENLAFLRFFVEDHDFIGPPPKERFEAMCGKIVDSVNSDEDDEPTFRSMWRADQQPRKLERMPTRVEFDNSTLREYTIIDIFAHGRVDLIYTVTRVLYGLNAHVHFFKCGTYLDQVVNVFYVTDALGHKIEDDGRLAELRLVLLSAVETG